MRVVWPRETRADPGGQRRPRSPLRFFVLVFALAVPFWLLGAVTGAQLSPDLPVAALTFVCPVIAAAMLVYRDNGAAGVTELLRRSFDYKRIRAKVWYAPVVLLLPAVNALTYAVMGLLGLPLPTVQFPVLTALVTFLVFFGAGLCEELGWSGYVLDPLQARWNALQAGVLLGLVWAAFHYVPLLQHRRSLAWIAWWSLATVAVRVLYTWLYNNTGRSVFAVALFHAMGNLSQIGPFLSFGPEGYPSSAQRISGLTLAVAAAVVTVVWGPRTLARVSG
jgi:uncharacterized protein